tara:strand:+ start:2618 stop:2845 length:228 start_codon:yes stop_codon:yes gene_type:complete
MGAYKQKMLEEMEDEDHTDEYGAFMDNDEAEWDFEDFEDKCEDDLIEGSIEDEAIEADIKRQELQNKKSGGNKDE